LHELSQKLFKGYARMKNSRWFNSICISQCFLADGKWQFETIEQRSHELKGEQTSLFE
jgi:hypothetical protein